MWVMKRLSPTEGRAKYGPHFRTYDSFVAQHIDASLSAECDNAHFAPVFGIWHLAYLAQFENALMAINPNITGAPYWDYRRDCDASGCNAGGPNGIFTDAMFGEYLAHESNGYHPRTGRFVGWTVSRHPTQYTSWTSLRGTSLRGPMNMVDSPYYTRHGGIICNHVVGVGNVTQWGACLEKEDIRDWQYCLDYDVHGMAHFGVGGSWPRYPAQPDFPGPYSAPGHNDCVAFYGMVGSRIEGRGMGSYIYPVVTGGLSCPKCTVETRDEDCVCSCATPDCVVRGIWTGRPEQNDTIIDPKWIHAPGDMYDPISSPNDPAFMFHHNNMVRYLYAWMERHKEQAPYYGYPRKEIKGGEGYCTPHLLDGVMGVWPFDDLFDDLPKGMTPRDVFERYSLAAAPYKFDTLE